MLYSGVSNRWRGWKAKHQGDLGVWDGRPLRQQSLKRFDGISRSCSSWDRPRKDPELCFRNGDCFIYLYEKGQSQQGAAYDVSIDRLLAAQARPLMERFLDRSMSEETAYMKGHIDLYVPTPATANRSQALQYHVAIRNFLAWVFGRPLVGDHLGNAIIGLVHSMDQFRDPSADNMEDLLNYLDDAGYRDMRNQPHHAVALLHVAEVFQIRDLFIDAFAHCVGMSERLYKCSELSRVSVASRKLIRRARADLESRLRRASIMLGDLLEEELSESHIGLSAGERAHLNRFRSYIRGFYRTKFGSFPPPPWNPRCGAIFRPDVYSTMKADFEALYEYLVDESFTTVDNSPPVAHGGLCTLQSVYEFDRRHELAALEHPLPLLPELRRAKLSRRRSIMPWLVDSLGLRESRLRPDQRRIAHAALLRATNQEKAHIMDNELVLAYQRFEEDSVLLHHRKGERIEKFPIGTGDARKVRWLLVYAMYQTLRTCAEIPKEVTYVTEVDYHLGASTKGTLPWQTGDNADLPPTLSRWDTNDFRPHTPQHHQSTSAAPLLAPVKPSKFGSGQLHTGMEIKPDIDYFALTHRGESHGRYGYDSEPAVLPRSKSHTLRRTMSFRRSLSVFKNASQRPATSHQTAAAPKAYHECRPMYHEIIVHGYGNGTYNAMDMPTGGTDSTEDTSVRAGSPAGRPILAATSRSASTTSTKSHSTSVSRSSTTAASSASTAPTTIVEPLSPGLGPQTSSSCKSPENPVSEVVTNVGPSDESHATTEDVNTSYDSLSFPSRRQSTRKSVRNLHSIDNLFTAASASEAPPPPPLPRRSSKRFSAPPSKRWSLLELVSTLRENNSDSSDSEADDLQPSPLRIRKTIGQRPRIQTHLEVDQDDSLRESSDWERLVHSASEVSPPCTWEQFTDLGGFQPIQPLK